MVSTIQLGPSLSSRPISHSRTAARTFPPSAEAGGREHAPTAISPANAKNPPIFPASIAGLRTGRTAASFPRLDCYRREALDVADRHGAREQEALTVGNAQRLQHAQLLASLDAFGDDLGVHLAREAHEGLEKVLFDL